MDTDGSSVHSHYELVNKKSVYWTYREGPSLTYAHGGACYYYLSCRSWRNSDQAYSQWYAYVLLMVCVMAFSAWTATNSPYTCCKSSGSVDSAIVALGTWLTHYRNWTNILWSAEYVTIKFIVEVWKCADCFAALRVVLTHAVECFSKRHLLYGILRPVASAT